VIQPPLPTPLPELSKARKPLIPWYEVLLGIGVANFIAALLMWLITSNPDAGHGYYALASIVILPLLIGFITGAIWRKAEVSIGYSALLSSANAFAAIGCAAIFLHEGAICLVMAFPLVFGLIWGGTVLGNLLFRPKGGNYPAGVSVIPLLLFALVWDSAQPMRDEPRVVTTTMLVHAPAARVFPHLVSFPRITAPPTFVLNPVGLPYPVETTADGAFVGANRTCRFSDNINIGERITQIVPGRTVAFAITHTPEFPEFTQHGRLVRGEMTVRDNGDGTSTLSGTSWYLLRVHPFWYFGAWADEIIHSVHGRVFTHIKELSER